MQRSIKYLCREEAERCVKEAYWRYDEIWTAGLRISPALLAHGRETINEINRLMPNFLTYRQTAPAIDELARDFGFDSDSELIEYLLNYKPRGPLRDSIFERLVAEHSTGAEDVPF